ncbi:MAG TPA: aminoacyl-tRNA hydrolase [Candidatus Margulisiibacteriota bacterium]|nr:aminoacyl-tRNA hydrolase [Candidatus Margulisiibacteriota bacterium]
MRIVVGLGNPGSEYAATRHNVGFRVVEELARRWQLALEPTGPSAQLAQGVIAGEYTMLMEPQLYMNRSGTALAEVVPLAVPSDLIVIHDDLDLAFGSVRVKRGGGTAGHRGLDSIADHWGHDFVRVRVGIGRPVHGQDVVTYVLSAFPAEQRAAAAAAVECAADAVECVVRDGEEKAMNRFNVRLKSGAVATPAPMGRK